MQSIGVDIVLFDAEDYGVPAVTYEGDTSTTWARFSQYWHNIHTRQTIEQTSASY